MSSSSDDVADSEDEDSLRNADMDDEDSEYFESSLSSSSRGEGGK